jgi:hypothetical protein
MTGTKVWGFMKGVASIVFFAVAVPDCKMDEEAHLQVTPGGKPLAVGAYQSLQYGDACEGGGKVSFCSSEGLVSLDELSSRNPGVAVIVPASEAPLAESTTTHFILGVAPGRATLVFRGTFDDGSVRSAEADVEVRKADRVKMSASCKGTETSQIVTKPGGEAYLDAKLFSGSTELAGLHPDALLPVAGLTRSPSFDSVNQFTWTAPPEPVSVDVRSALVSGSVGTLLGYGPADVSDIVVDSSNGSSLVTWQGGSTRIAAMTKVRGVEPCHVNPVVFRTETPAVCSGPAGALTWQGKDESGGFVEMNAEGTCRVSASADGVRFFRPGVFRFFFVEEPGAEKFDGFNQPCAVEGSTSCTYGDNSQVTICREGRWTTKEQCGPTRTCDARDPASSGCVAGGPCSHCRNLMP